MYSRRLTAFLLVVSILFPGYAGKSMAARATADLANDWKFIKQDVDATAPVTNWDAVTIPHTWNNLDAQ